MSKLSIRLSSAQTAFRPGQGISGEVAWDLDHAPGAIEVRLLWFTRGKGTQDTATANTLRSEQLSQTGSFPFAFTLPDAPYSFCGKLVSLVWAIEAATEHPEHSERVEITMSPTGREINLLDDSEWRPATFSSHLPAPPQGVTSPAAKQNY